MMKRLSESVPQRTSGASIARTSGPDTAGAGAGAPRAGASTRLATAGGPLATACQPRSVGRADLAAAFAPLLLAEIALGPLWRSGIPAADDLLASIYRVFALHEGWKAGNFYPALSADLSFGYSAPLFLYYPPLASYVAELFHFAGLGFIGALKASYLLALCLSGWGMYAYGRVIIHTRRAAFLAAVAYLLAPYQLLNIFKRAALAEIVALALLPWVLWTLHTLYLRGGRARFVLARLSLAGLLIANNSIALFLLPAILVYLTALFLTQRNWPRLLLGGGALALGLGLSVFFWLPAIAERGAVNILPLMESFAHPTQHLLILRDLVQHGLAAEYWNGQTPRWALIPALLAFCAVLTLRWQPRGTRRWLAILHGADRHLLAAATARRLGFLDPDTPGAFYPVALAAARLRVPGRRSTDRLAG